MLVDWRFVGKYGFASNTQSERKVARIQLGQPDVSNDHYVVVVVEVAVVVGVEADVGVGLALSDAGVGAEVVVIAEIRYAIRAAGEEEGVCSGAAGEGVVARAAVEVLSWLSPTKESLPLLSRRRTTRYAPSRYGRAGEIGVNSVKTATAVLSLALLASPWQAWPQAVGDHQYTSEAIELGSRVYTSQCTLCHGPQGGLVDGIDLRLGIFRDAASDEDLRRAIAEGSGEGRMPAFDLSTGEMDGIIAYIRAGFDPEGVAVKIGDPARGEALFFGRGACADCHRVGGGEFGILGYVAAYYAETGELAWKTYTIPGPGEPGHETWEGDDWRHGGAPVWITGSFDPDENLTCWGVGNPGPDWNAAQRPGDNLYSDSVIALDADSGELRWHFQFTPNDGYDYDAVQVPVLADMEWGGERRKLMLWANRNGYFYVLDRVDGEYLLGKPFVRVNWSSGLDENGRPIPTPQPQGMPTYPGNQGATNWYPPSWSPRTELFYFSAWEDYATIYQPEESEYVPGRAFLGGGFTVLTPAPGTPWFRPLRIPSSEKYQGEKGGCNNEGVGCWEQRGVL